MSRDQVLGIVRHVLTFGSGYVIAKGWVDESVAAEAVAALVGLAGVVWSYVAKK